MQGLAVPIGISQLAQLYLEVVHRLAMRTNAEIAVMVMLHSSSLLPSSSEGIYRHACLRQLNQIRLFLERALLESVPLGFGVPEERLGVVVFVVLYGLNNVLVGQRR